MIEAELRQTRSIEISLRCHPEQMAYRFLPTEQCRQKTRDRRQVTHHVMDAAPRQAAARQAAVDLRYPDGQHGRISPLAQTAAHAGELVAELLNRRRVKHADRNKLIDFSSQYVLFPNIKAYVA